MNRARYAGWTAAGALALFLAYDHGKSDGRQEVKRADLLEECVNTRFSGLESLKAQVVDYGADLAASRTSKPVDFTKKADFEKFSKAVKEFRASLVPLRENCKSDVDAGVTDFKEETPSEAHLTTQMKKQLQEQYLDLLRSSAGQKQADSKGKS